MYVILQEDLYKIYLSMLKTSNVQMGALIFT